MTDGARAAHVRDVTPGTAGVHAGPAAFAGPAAGPQAGAQAGPAAEARPVTESAAASGAAEPTPTGASVLPEMTEVGASVLREIPDAPADPSAGGSTAPKRDVPQEGATGTAAAFTAPAGDGVTAPGEDADAPRLVGEAVTYARDNSSEAPQPWDSRASAAPDPTVGVGVSGASAVAERSAGGTHREPGIAPAGEQGMPPSGDPGMAPAPQDAAEPVSQAARRFLRPVVGIDPAEARLHRGEFAAQVTSTLGADAVTVGRDIFLAPGEGEANPSGWGLLAHELTHAAADHTRDDDEARARQVEANVQSAAAAAGTATHDVLPAPPSGVSAQPAPATGVPAQPTPATGDSAQPSPASGGSAQQTPATGAAAPAAHTNGHATPHAAVTTGASTNFQPGPTDALHPPAASPDSTTTTTGWNGLPAPWEPLPDWLTVPPSDWPSTPAPDAAPQSSSGSGTHGNGNGNGAPFDLAELQRDLPPPESQPTPAGGDESTHPQTAAPGVEPDLDALARQVYILLRRRLASERRRFG